VELLFTLLMLLPLILALWLANLSQRKRIEGQVDSERLLKLIAYGILALLYGGLLLLGLLLQGVGLLAGGRPDYVEMLAASGMTPEALPRMALGMWLPSLFGLLMLTRPARRLVARISNIDPAHPVHAVALSMSGLVLVNLLFTLGIGIDNLADMLEATSEAGAGATSVSALWAQNIAFLVMSVIGVGWLAHRTFRGALNRLGIVMPSLPQILLGLGAGVLMVPLVLLLEMLASRLNLGTSAGVEKLTEILVGPLTTSVWGILTLGLAAALGEESIFRGALQPRFGLVLTTLLFALLHSQYGLSFSTVAVFGVGLVLGLLRMRTNTTTAMLTHAVYNISLGAITYFGWLQNL
jgi:uncharacterized protein